MKILHLNENDSMGGAAIATRRLHEGLTEAGIDSTLFVQRKYTSRKDVYTYKSGFQSIINTTSSRYNRFPKIFYPERKKEAYNTGYSLNSLAPVIKEFKPDIIHLHWIADGFININELKRFNIPVVWSLHDMWPFTGGCHYSYDCSKYTFLCGCCPVLCSTKKNDLAFKVFQSRSKSIKNLNLTVVSPSRWLSDSASNSAIFRDSQIATIPHGLNLEIFKPAGKNHSRAIHYIPEDKKIILFGGINPHIDKRKGFHLLEEALNILKNKKELENCELLVFGCEEKMIDFQNAIKTTYSGYIAHDIAMPVTYSAADVMIVPSYQEAFGLTALEAMACGTPVVAFDTTGPKDIVTHKESGYLASPYEPEDLAEGIKWVLKNNSNALNISENARNRVVKEFDVKNVVQKYSELYSKILNN